ncbi:hypothetical protein SBOR_5023 [Sclerotinia borealis F-4128]|uniref:Uncharacterized protein n=1 Tax=Sclerotinia borealis (strain F-4128) TaxID=1432307 RepID=W9CCW6_SCLBF|nr:hypothetical protein SBOR_5023 [Sclerotinia borealis F-4128]
MDSLGKHVGIDHHVDIDARAVNLAFTAFLISNLVAWLFMVVIQYFIFKVLYYSNQQSLRQGSPPTSRSLQATSIKGPTTGETYLLVGGLWLIHAFVNAILSSILDTFVWLFSSPETAATYMNWRDSLYNMRYWAGGVKSGVAGSVKMLAVELIATWILSQTFLLISDTLIPLLYELRQDHKIVLARIQQRVLELHHYVRMMDWENDSELVTTKMEDESSNGNQEQIIELSRQRSESLTNGDHERKLDWILVIDEEALNEMKEMLGPPGGFGELGFNVAKDRVCLGAVSRGSSFILTFELEGSEDERKKAGKRSGRRGVEIERNNVERN